MTRKASNVLQEKKRERQIRRRKMGREERKSELIDEALSKIILDPEIQLPYGFGFDDYIVELKERNLGTQNNAFLYNIKRIFL